MRPFRVRGAIILPDQAASPSCVSLLTWEPDFQSRQECREASPGARDLPRLASHSIHKPISNILFPETTTLQYFPATVSGFSSLGAPF